MNNSLNKLVIADTQFLVVEALHHLLSLDSRFETIRVTDSKYDLMKMLAQESFCLLITDPQMFDYDGPNDLKFLSQNFPDMPILVLTNSVGKAEFAEFSKSGIKNMIYKTADRDEVLAAVDAAMKSKKYYSEEILDLIFELKEPKADPEKPAHLTSTEMEIVRLISGGMTTKEIANLKNISFHTVNTHRKNIFKKLGVTNASELIMLAIKAGWIDNIEYYI